MTSQLHQDCLALIERIGTSAQLAVLRDRMRINESELSNGSTVERGLEILAIAKARGPRSLDELQKYLIDIVKPDHNGPAPRREATAGFHRPPTHIRSAVWGLGILAALEIVGALALLRFVLVQTDPVPVVGLGVSSLRATPHLPPVSRELEPANPREVRGTPLVPLPRRSSNEDKEKYESVRQTVVIGAFYEIVPDDPVQTLSVRLGRVKAKVVDYPEGWYRATADDVKLLMQGHAELRRVTDQKEEGVEIRVIIGIQRHHRRGIIDLTVMDVMARYRPVVLETIRRKYDAALD